MDIIYLKHLTVDTVIGVWEWERRIRQTLILDLELGLDTRQAGETDDLQYTVDYKAVTDRVRDYARDSQFKLIEALGENITRILLAEFPVHWVRLQINKQGVVDLDVTLSDGSSLGIDLHDADTLGTVIEQINAAYSMGASRWQVFLRLRVPSALPYFFSGLRISAGLEDLDDLLADIEQALDVA